MKIFYIFLFLIVFLSSIRGSEIENDFPLFPETEYTYLVSFPRSGNTLCRFLIEYLLKTPTRSRLARLVPKPTGNSFGKILGFEINLKSPPVIKKHTFTPYFWANPNEKHNLEEGRVIFLLRNPLRHMDKIENYFSLLQQYQVHPRKKLLIYFEDLIEDPIGQIQKISIFINQPINADRLKTYFENPEKLRLKCAKLYDNPRQPILHSYKDPKYKINLFLQENNIEENAIHEELFERYPLLYQSYLSRYFVPSSHFF